MFKKILKTLSLLLFLFSCSSNAGFYIYDLNGEEINLNHSSNRRTYKFNDNIVLFFDRNDIKKEYIEVNVIASKHYYYGDFYFDQSFCKLEIYFLNFHLHLL